MTEVPYYLVQYGASKIAAAQAAFNKLLQEYGGANIVLQITAAGKTELIGNAVRETLYWGSTGSLWEAYKALERIEITPEMAPFLTEEMRQIFKNRIIEAISSL